MWLNICDDKHGLAEYLWKRLPEIRGDKRDSTLNIAELLPNMCDNHQRSWELRLFYGPVSEILWVDSVLPSKVSWAYTFAKGSTVWPNNCDDKRGLAKYV